MCKKNYTLSFELTYNEWYINKVKVKLLGYMLDHLQPLIDSSVKMSFGVGSTILYQGEVPRSACVLVSGAVRVFSISPQGDEQIVMFHMPGEFFPTSWIYGKSPGTLFFYQTISESVVAFVQREELLQYMNAEPTRMEAMLEYFASNYSASLIRINALQQPRARDKILYTLYFLCQRYGKVIGPKVRILLTLTHQDMAGLVGLTRETAAVELHQLKKQGVISYRQQRYLIDMEALLALIGEDSFRNLSIQSQDD